MAKKAKSKAPKKQSLEPRQHYLEHSLQEWNDLRNTETSDQAERD